MFWIKVRQQWWMQPKQTVVMRRTPSGGVTTYVTTVYVRPESLPQRDRNLMAYEIERALNSFHFPKDMPPTFSHMPPLSIYEVDGEPAFGIVVANVKLPDYSLRDNPIYIEGIESKKFFPVLVFFYTHWKDETLQDKEWVTVRYGWARPDLIHEKGPHYVEEESRNSWMRRLEEKPELLVVAHKVLTAWQDYVKAMRKWAKDPRKPKPEPPSFNFTRTHQS